MPERAPDGTAYELSGSEGAPLVALIHGLGLHRGTWRRHEPALTGRYRVLNYDLLGHGESPAPPETASLDLFARQLAGLLDHIGSATAALVGFSLGGMINRRFAIDFPDRVSALAILNSPHERGQEQQELVERRAADSAAGGPGATLDSTIERWFTAEFRRTRPDVIDQVRAWVLANDPDSYAQCRWVLARGVVELISPRPPLTHPMLVMTAENDSGSTPAMSHAIAAETPGARTVIVPGLRHMGLIEQPALFVDAVLRFLDEALS